MIIPNFNQERAVDFLRTSMYIPENKLFVESTKPTGTKHYISSANCLASTAIRPYYLKVSNDCIAQIKSLKTSLSKVIETYWYPLFHDFLLSEIPSIIYKELGTTETSWTTLNGHEVVCNNSVAGTVDCATNPYSNRSMLYALMKLKAFNNGGTNSDLTTAQACFSRALSFWDGKGFADEAGDVHYDSYKTALGLYCLNFPELKSVSDAAGSHKLNIRSDYATALQGSNGGIFGRYLYNSSNDTLYVEDTFENTESTSLMLLASPCV